MSADVGALSSGKDHRDENFPVASFLIAPKNRGVILAFYRFVRAADDVADNATAAPGDKLRLLDAMRRTLLGQSEDSDVGVVLRSQLQARGLDCVHALDLLEAFTRDVTKLRYADWDDLIGYCRVSAMPVGRFVLDVHGESRLCWPASDALCAALQIVNHLQDCGKDYRDLDRVYIPLDAFATETIGPEALAADTASPPLRRIIARLAERNAGLLQESAGFARLIADSRLALEVSLIHTLAADLNRKLVRRDPLSERVHHRKSDILFLALPAFFRFLKSRKRGAPSTPALREGRP